MKGRVALAIGALTVSTAVGACGGARTATVPTAGDVAPSEVPPDLLPAQLGDLTVSAEDISKLQEEAGENSYLASTRLWALRTGPRLRATLQVGRFVPDARYDDEEFQQRIVGHISSTGSRTRVLGEAKVYATSANQQAVYIWFRGPSLLVLTVSADYPTPRALLREALAVGS